MDNNLKLRAEKAEKLAIMLIQQLNETHEWFMNGLNLSGEELKEHYISGFPMTQTTRLQLIYKQIAESHQKRFHPELTLKDIESLIGLYMDKE